METKMLRVIDYEEFDALVNTHLKPPQPYECVPDNEWSNDTSYEMSVSEQGYTGGDREGMADYLSGKKDTTAAFITPASLLSELALRGHLPWGDYLITVCW